MKIPIIKMMVLIAMVVVMARPVSAAELTLEESIDRALEHNYGMRISGAQQGIAEQDVVAARASFFPTITGSASAMTMDNYGAAVAGIGTDGENYGASISIVEPLLTFGKRSNAVSLARLGVTSAEQSETITRNALALQVTQGFYSYLLAEELVAIANDAYALALEQADYAEKRFAEGYVSEFDLLRAQTNGANKKPAIVQAENMLAQTEELLLTVINDRSLTRFQAVGELLYTPVSITEADAVDQAVAANAELAQLQLAYQAKEIEVSLQRSQHYPDLSAAYTYNYNRPDYEVNNVATLHGKDYSDWAAGIQLDIPIFSGFATQARLAKAEAELAQLADVVAQAENWLALEVTQLVKNLHEHEAIIMSSQEAVKLATMALGMARISYDNGLSTTLDVDQAQVALTASRTDYIQAVYKYLITVAELEKLMGRSVAVTDSVLLPEEDA